MYELIIFTLMLPNVKPLWIHLEPTNEAQCIERVESLELAFADAKGLVFSFTCKEVKNELPIQETTSSD